MAIALLLASAITVGVLISDTSEVAAQAQPCTLLTADEIHALAPMEDLSEGLASVFDAVDSSTCRYTWGSGAGRHTLVLHVNPASRMFTGMNADSVKQTLLASITAGTTDEAVADVGDAAVFKVYSAIYVGATALLKGRVLQVNLDGIDAREKKGQLISLLKSAASRL